MSLIKLIKLHRKLRINQEICCNRITKYSQDKYTIKIGKEETINYDHNLNMLSSHNKAVHKIEKKLPSLYFFISDLFFLSNLKKQINKNIVI